MRIGYFINQYPKVSHTFIRREIAALERQGVQVQRYALRGWDAEVQDPEDRLDLQRTRHVLRGGAAGLLLGAARDLLVHPARGWRALRMALALARHADRPWPYHLVYLAEACRLRRWLAEDGIDHVHAHFGTNSTEVVLLAHLLGGPRFSFTVHGPEEFDKPQFIALDRKAAEAAFVVAISSYGRSQLWRWLPAAQWPKVQVVHCGLEAGFFLPIAEVAAQPVPRLVCVGRLCEQKGQLLLIEAAAQLAARHVDFELVLAGDGEMRPDVEAAIRRHGLQDRVRITGWIGSAQVRSELLAARALVLPSFAEGLPVVLMEAMSLGRPVVTTGVAGIPELVRDGVDGWLVPAGDGAALGDALQACLQAPPERLQAMGQAARERVQARHAIDPQAARLKALFAQAVAEAQPC